MSRKSRLRAEVFAPDEYVRGDEPQLLGQATPTNFMNSSEMSADVGRCPSAASPEAPAGENPWRLAGARHLHSGQKFTMVCRMLDWAQCPAVERIPGKVSGAWLFKDTRVPVKTLFENIEGGATVQEFLEWFPGVTREQIEAVLEYAQRSLEAA